MSFLNPHALWLLVLLLVLLWRKRRTPRRQLAVGALHLWRDDSRDAAGWWQRLQRHRLLIVQLAVVAALVGALARPVLPLESARVAVLVDVSASMGTVEKSRIPNGQSQAPTRLDLAQALVRQAVESLPRRTRVHLIAFHAWPENLGEFGASDARLEAALGRTRPSAAAADIDTALQRAQSAGASRFLVFTDSPAPTAIASDRSVEWHVVGSPQDNVAITTLAAARSAADPALLDILIEVDNFGDSTIQFPLTLHQDGHPLWTESLTISARGSATIVRRVSSSARIVEGRLAIVDALAADNSRVLVLRDPDVRIRVLGNNLYVRLALSSIPGVTLAFDTPPTGGNVAAAADVTVCIACDPVVAGGLRTLADSGHGVLVIHPWAGAELPAAPLIVLQDPPLSRADTLDGLVVRPATGLERTSATILARAGGIPVIAASEHTGRRVFELALDVSDPGLTLQPAFPLLIGEAIRWLAKTEERGRTVEGGQPMPFAEALSGSTTDRSTAGAGPFQSMAGATFGWVATAGIHEVTIGSRRERVGVNIAKSESDLSLRPAAPATAPLVTALMPHPVEASPFLLVVALIALIVEWQLRKLTLRHRRVVSGG